MLILDCPSTVRGDRKSIHQIADVINTVYGFKPEVETLGSLDELYKRMHALRKEYPDETFK